MRIILLGAPGSGKGTVGELVERVYGLPRIATGDLLRRAVQERTPLGLRAAEHMGRGGLVPDDLVVALGCTEPKRRTTGQDIIAWIFYHIPQVMDFM